MFDLVIKGGLVVRPDETFVADLGISAGTIQAVERGGNPLDGQSVVDAAGKYVFPGIVDAHMHIPGYFLSSRLDNFDTATAAAALGGVTTLMIQPTEDPRTVTPAYFARKRRLGEEQSHVDFCIQALISPQTEREEIEGMAAMGAVSYELYLAYGGNPGFVIGNDDYELFRLLDLVRAMNGVAGITPHSYTLIAKLTELQKAEEEARPHADPRRKAKVLPSGVREFAVTRPTLSEGLGITRACTVAAETGTRLHLRALSSQRSVDLARRFKDAAPITTEVMTHHLLFVDSEAEGFGPYGKIVPPIRSKAERDALRACIREGRIDMVVSDHSPVLEEDKDDGWADIWQTLPGMPGLQTFFPSLIALVDDGVLGITDIARSAAAEPARHFGLAPRKGAIAVGADADLIVADPNRPAILDNAAQRSRARYTTMRGRKVSTSIDSVYLRGRLLAQGDALVAPKGGRFVAPC
ncbi:MAG: amidohydrolase family protein [Rhodospirillaceae bacterium]|nr:amidohydrolase family protein [Rhodospirillaceae bacterium]